MWQLFDLWLAATTERWVAWLTGLLRGCGNLQFYSACVKNASVRTSVGGQNGRCKSYPKKADVEGAVAVLEVCVSDFPVPSSHSPSNCRQRPEDQKLLQARSILARAVVLASSA